MAPWSVTFLLFDGFSNMVLANALEPLRAACDLCGRQLFRWRVATVAGAEAISSSRLRLQPNPPDLQPADVLAVVAGYDVRDHLRPAALRALRREARGAGLVAGLDTGAWLLAGAGLLDGRRATIHWMARQAFAEAFPAVETVEARYVADGPVVTCGSAEGVLDWSLQLIGRQGGTALRFDVGAMFGRPSGAAGATAGATTLPPPLQRAILAMRRSAEAPLPLAAIAAEAGVSPRTLDRLFAEALGLPAGRYYRHLRLAQARTLATETRLGLAEIAARSGFGSPATLARAYRARYGETVGASREQR